MRRRRRTPEPDPDELPGGRARDDAVRGDALISNRAAARLYGEAQSTPAGASAGAALGDHDLAAGIEAGRRGGSPLSPAARTGMEDTLGRDLGAVRLHTGAAADELSRALEASAFTVGSDVFFRAGAFSPDTPAGAHLLAHELAHVVQQRHARAPVAASTPVTDPSAASEVAARRAADAVGAADTGRVPLTVQRKPDGEAGTRTAKTEVSLGSVQARGAVTLAPDDKLKLKLDADAVSDISWFSFGPSVTHEQKPDGDETSVKGIAVVRLGPEGGRATLPVVATVNRDGTVELAVRPALSLLGGRLRLGAQGGYKEGEKRELSYGAQLSLQQQFAGGTFAGKLTYKQAAAKSPEVGGALSLSPRSVPLAFDLTVDLKERKLPPGVHGPELPSAGATQEWRVMLWVSVRFGR